MANLQTIFETCTPRDEVLTGELRDEMFAANLSNVIQGVAHPIYQDAEQFLLNTYPTDRVRSFVKEVLGRLTGSDRTASSFFRLDTPFGGGKTHTLITLYHLTQGNIKPTTLSKFSLTEAELPSEPVKVITVVGDDLDPSNGTKHEDIKVHHLWGEIAWQLGGKHGYEMVAESDIKGISPNSHFLKELIGDKPCLILLDEPAIYMRKMGTNASQLPVFLKTLSEWVTTGASRCVLVLTLAWNPERDVSQKDAFIKENRVLAEELEAVFNEISSVVSRPAKVVTPAQEQDIAPILRQRLFKNVDDAAIEQIAEAYFTKLRDAQGQEVEVPSSVLTPAYRARLEQSYPFHPEFISLMDGKLATIPNFQRTRGALRLLSRVIRRLWEVKPEGVFYIQPFCVDVIDPTILDELSGRLDRPGFQQVARYDIGREDESSHAQVIDKQRFPGHIPYTRRVASTIFLHSLTEPPARGVDLDELMAAAITPDCDPAILRKALEYLLNEAWHLDFEGHRYYFRTEPSLNKIVLDETSNVLKHQARVEVERRMKLLWKSSGLQVKFFPNDPSDLDDIPKGRLVIPHWDTVSIKQTERKADKFLVELFEYAGTQRTYRRYRNTIFVIAADGDRIERMVDNARRWLALDGLMRNEQKLNDYKLSKEHRQRLNEWRGKSDLECTISITRAYHDLFYPSDDATSSYKPFSHQGLQVESQGDVKINHTDLVIKALRDLSKVKSADDNPMSPALIKRDTFGKDEGRVKTSDLFDRFAEKVKLPLLLEPTYLKAIIKAGVKGKEWIYYDPKENLGYNSAEGLPEIVLDEEHEVLLPELVDRESIPVFGADKPEPPGTGGGGDDDGGGMGGTPTPFPVGKSLSEKGEPKRLMADLLSKAKDAGWESIRQIDINWNGSGLDTVARLKAGQMIIGRMAGTNVTVNKLNVSYEYNDGSAINVTSKGASSRYDDVVSFAERQATGATKSLVLVGLMVGYPSAVPVEGTELDDLRDVLELADIGTADVTVWRGDAQ